MPDSAPEIEQVNQPAAAVLGGQAGVPNLAGAQPAAPAAHTRVGQIFHSVLDTLSGGQTEPAMNDKGAIAEQPVTRTGGEWARRLLAGAFTGLASGAAAPVRPGAGALAGLGAGFAGETEQLQKQDVQKRQQLQKNFENEAAQKQAGNEDLLRKAQTAYLTTQNTSLGFQLARSKAEATDKAVESFNAFEKTVGAAAGSQDLGTFPDMKAVLAYQKEHPELTHQIAGHPSVGGQLYVSPGLAQDEEGNWTYQGVRAAFIPQDVSNQTVAQVFGDKPVPGIPYFSPGKMKADGTQESGTWQTYQPATGIRYGDYLTALQKGAVDAGRENSALAAAQANKANADAKTSPSDAKEDARLDKGYQFNSTQLEKERTPIEAAVAKVGAAMANLNLQSPQADALLAPQVLSIAAGGAGSGLRMNEAEISRIVGGATNWTQLQTAVNRWSTDPTKATFTPAQRKQMADILTIAGQRGAQKVQVLEWGEQQLIDADKPESQRQATVNVRKFLDAVDQGKVIERNQKTGELRIATGSK